MKETTSAGKSGVHFGNLIACAEDEQLAQFESSVSQIPFLTGYSPTLWKEGTIVMIKKKAGNADVSALRSIVLLEADYNFNNKILGKRAMEQAEDLKAIAPEQYEYQQSYAPTMQNHVMIAYFIQLPRLHIDKLEYLWHQ